MKEIRIDTGVVEYTLFTSTGEKCIVAFNPTDTEFVNRLNSTFEELDRNQESYKKEVEDAGNNFRKIYEISVKRDTEMRALLDALFDKPICKDLFGDMNVYAMASGLPVWANFVMALIDETKDTFDAENKLSTSRIQKYMDKYKKK